jgi:hypothetical protein
MQGERRGKTSTAIDLGERQPGEIQDIFLLYQNAKESRFHGGRKNSGDLN